MKPNPKTINKFSGLHPDLPVFPKNSLRLIFLTNLSHLLQWSKQDYIWI